MPVPTSLKPYLRVGIISFGAGAVASFLAGMTTSGVAAAYLLVGLWVWEVIMRLGGAALANDRVVLVLAIALIHGLVFSIIVSLGRLVFPKLRDTVWGGNALLMAAIVYAVLLAFAFPLKDTL
jgi:hypothetical protein